LKLVLFFNENKLFFDNNKNSIDEGKRLQKQENQFHAGLVWLTPPVLDTPQPENKKYTGTPDTSKYKTFT